MSSGRRWFARLEENCGLSRHRCRFRGRIARRMEASGRSGMAGRLSISQAIVRIAHRGVELDHLSRTASDRCCPPADIPFEGPRRFLVAIASCPLPAADGGRCHRPSAPRDRERSLPPIPGGHAGARITVYKFPHHAPVSVEDERQAAMTGKNASGSPASAPSCGARGSTSCRRFSTSERQMSGSAAPEDEVLSIGTPANCPSTATVRREARHSGWARSTRPCGGRSTRSTASCSSTYYITYSRLGWTS